MEARAAIPVSLPQPNPTISYWQDPPDAELADYLSASSPPEDVVDTVIIGSGITGACAAWGLLGGDDDQNPNVTHVSVKKKERIVMLEARQACSGATGRNGGHTKASSYRSFPSTAASHGLLTAVQTARLQYTNVRSVHAFARKHDIDCDLFSGDTVDIIYDAAQWDNAVKSVEAMRKAMPEDLEGAAEYELWNATDARERFWVADDADGRGDSYGEVKGAVSYKAGSLSAYKFVIGVLKLCLKLGLELFTNTPVLKLSKNLSGLWELETSYGIVTARRVVLATNGYTAFLAPQFQSSIVPLRGQITAHRPGSNMPKTGLQTTYSFIYQNGYEYMIPRPLGSKFAGDIVIGGGLVVAKDEGLMEFGTTDDANVNTEISEYLTGTTPRYFGKSWGADAHEGRIRREWTGIMGYSGDAFPFVGAVPGQDGLWVSASFQGHGMVLCWMCVRALVGMMSGRDDEELKRWFPDAFKVTEERLGIQFRGRLHTKPPEKE